MKKLLLLFDEEFPEPPAPPVDKKLKHRLLSPDHNILMLDGEPIGTVSHFEVARERPVQRVFPMNGGPHEINFGATRRTYEVNVQSMHVDFDALERAVRGTFPAWMSTDDMILRDREASHVPGERGLVRHRLTYEALDLERPIGMSMGCRVEQSVCNLCGHQDGGHRCEHNQGQDTS